MASIASGHVAAEAGCPVPIEGGWSTAWRVVAGSRVGPRARMLLMPPGNYRAALWAGFVGGNIASFVKWGSEEVMPPRAPGRPVPPVEVLRSLGLDADAMTYRYSGQTLNYGSVAVHQGFSVAFGMLYAALVERYPRVGRYYGTEFGLVLTLAFHGAVLPLGRWAPPIWDLPMRELASETLGHLLWIWAIEFVRRDLRGPPVRAPSAEALRA